MRRALTRLTRRAFSAQPARAATPFAYEPLFQAPTPGHPMRKLTSDYVSTATVNGRTILNVEPEALRLLASSAMVDIAHLLRPGHLQQLANILDDPEASANDRFVALELLKNANVAASKVLPGCQDTGTAIVMGKRGQYVWTDGADEEHLSKGVFDTYTGTHLRYSQVAPLDMFTEANTKCNLPAQVEIYATPGSEYGFHFMAKGGGSANKTFLFQQTKARNSSGRAQFDGAQLGAQFAAQFADALPPPSPQALLNPESLAKFMEEKIATLGTSACPPYHLAIVVGGLSAEMTLKTVKYASARYYDSLPTSGSDGGRAFRDVELEGQIHEMTQKMGIGAQFGGKYFCHDVRVVRLPRHGASCPVAIGVSCSADRQALGKINAEGVWLEELEADPAKYLPEVQEGELSDDVVKVDLNRPMDEVRAQLSACAVKTRLSLTGTLVVARDIAHAKLQERIDSGEGLPQYMRDHAVYYAGPAKTPEGYASGSFGPTTAGRMDSYVASFQKAGGSMVMLAKGNRSKQVTKACEAYGGFYLGSIGGPAAILAKNSIKNVEVLEYPELGMEAIWKIEVEDFPAFVVVDDKGNDFFAKWAQ